ncbi:MULTISPECIES: serine O-acetyltransferase [Janthinobacterium]|uniref:serine O-acetyltransferase n=1 Tax=Janthinobacterium TaxID=29580 RepID=UPI001F07C92A|nr:MULTISPECIES: DapH/DapD/GlmU-related protein [Janthinobacterium]
MQFHQLSGYAAVYRRHAAVIHRQLEKAALSMLRIFRLSAWLHRHRIPFLPRMLYVLNRMLFAVVLPPGVTMGSDVLLAYSGLGIVVHARTVIGDRVKISQNVTIGGRAGLLEVPVIEDDVEIGAGACVLGPITIGRGAKIGANAVVLHDVPAGATAVGIPARAIS